ncbi:MAG: pilus assembly protein PilM [Hyphomonadaceae bacterium]|nr:pilus assembly protein PilM [Clostridia bacterium]
MFSKKITALDIGTSNIKIIYAVVSGRQARIKKQFIIDTPDGCILNGRITDAVALADLLNKFFKQNHFEPRDTVITFSSASFITRDMIIPKVPVKEIHGMIEMELPQNFPVSLDNHVWDYKVIEEIQSANGMNYRVLVAAVPQYFAAEYMQLAMACNMNLLSLDFSCNSVAELIKQDYYKKLDTAPYQTIMAMDFGSSSTKVTIVSKGMFMFHRILPFGGMHITQAIMKHMNVDEQGAEILKKEIGIDIVGEDELIPEMSQSIQVSDCIRAVLIEMFEDLSRFFDYYNSRQNENIDFVLLTGGGAQLKNLEQYLENTYNIPTKIYAVYSNVKATDTQKLSENALYLTNSIGALFNK